MGEINVNIEYTAYFCFEKYVIKEIISLKIKYEEKMGILYKKELVSKSLFRRGKQSAARRDFNLQGVLEKRAKKYLNHARKYIFF